MRTIRYINLLDKFSKVQTRKCFIYNNTIFFAVEKKQVSKAIGLAAINIREIQTKTGKKVRIIGEAEGIKDLKRFISDIVYPTKIKSVELEEKCARITAGNNQNKAALIGRDKRRYDELKKIIQDFFGYDLKIV